MEKFIRLDAKHQKWISLTGGVIINLTLGVYYTFGNINPYLTSYLRDNTNSDVRYSNSIWIQSWIASFQAVAAILCGLLSLRGVSPRLIAFCGCLTMSFGILITCVTVKHSLELVTLTYGVLNGFGNGLAYVPPLTIVMKWFPTRKGEANAIVLCGFGAGGLIFTELQSLYINPNNYAPDKAYSDKFPDEKYYSKVHEDLLDNVPKSFLIVGLCVFVMQMIGCFLMSEPPTDVQTQTINSHENEQSINTNTNEKDSVVSIEPTDDKQVLSNATETINSLGVDYAIHAVDSGLPVQKMLKIPAFYLLWFIFLFSLLVPSIISSYYKAFGETFITSDKFLSLVGSLSSVFNAVGRPLWGFFFDKAPFKVCMLVLNTSLVCLCGTIYITKIIGSDVIFLIWVGLIYLVFSGIYVMMPTITAKCFGQKYFAMNYGLMYTCGIVASLSVAFLGELIDKVGWFGLFTSIAGFSLISWFITFFFYVKKSNGDDL